LDRSQLLQLRRLLSIDREACAGSNVKPILRVRSMVGSTLIWAHCHNIPMEFIREITKARNLLIEAKDYGDRLEPDRILCDLLNRLDKVIG